ncbi:unnamed protein product [Coccothraustes coccothraustes]
MRALKNTAVIRVQKWQQFRIKIIIHLGLVRLHLALSKNLKRFLANGPAPTLGGPWLQVQPGSGLQQCHGTPRPLSPATVAACPLRCLRVTARGLCPSRLRAGSDLQVTCSQRIPPEGRPHCSSSSSEHHCGLKVNAELVGIAFIPRGRCAVWTWLRGSARQNRLAAAASSLSSHWEGNPKSLLSSGTQQDVAVPY